MASLTLKYRTVSRTVYGLSHWPYSVRLVTLTVQCTACHTDRTVYGLSHWPYSVRLVTLTVQCTACHTDRTVYGLSHWPYSVRLVTLTEQCTACHTDRTVYGLSHWPYSVWLCMASGGVTLLPVLRCLQTPSENFLIMKYNVEQELSLTKGESFYWCLGNMLSWRLRCHWCNLIPLGNAKC